MHRPAATPRTVLDTQTRARPSAHSPPSRHTATAAGHYPAGGWLTLGEPHHPPTASHTALARAPTDPAPTRHASRPQHSRTAQRTARSHKSLSFASIPARTATTQALASNHNTTRNHATAQPQHGNTLMEHDNTRQQQRNLNQQRQQKKKVSQRRKKEAEKTST